MVRLCLWSWCSLMCVLEGLNFPHRWVDICVYRPSRCRRKQPVSGGKQQGTLHRLRGDSPPGTLARRRCQSVHLIDMDQNVMPFKTLNCVEFVKSWLCGVKILCSAYSADKNQFQCHPSPLSSFHTRTCAIQHFEPCKNNMQATLTIVLNNVDGSLQLRLSKQQIYSLQYWAHLPFWELLPCAKCNYLRPSVSPSCVGRFCLLPPQTGTEVYRHDDAAQSRPEAPVQT